MIVRDPTVAERYAQALFHTAKKQNKAVEMMHQVESIGAVFQQGAKLRIFFEAPQISTEDKERVIRKILEGRVDDLIVHLVLLLLRKGRMEYTRPVLERFRILVENDQGIYEAQIATAKALSDPEKTTMQKSLEAFAKARLKVQYVVEPELIAGVRFSYGDVLIDDTVRGKLYKLRQQLETAARA